MTILFLSVEEVIDIHRSTLSQSGSPDINKLEGAIHRIHSLYHYEGVEDVFQFAAMYLIAIAKAHAFHDGNKRTAFQSVCIFLMINGVELNSSYELVKLTVLAAIGEANRENTAFTLKVLSNYHSELIEDSTSGY
ncbi:hypothetical protein AHYW_002609 [Providencia manganoxydans]|uniref:type II toxin-antitoxin system death-on-curing family toxin n=1 Tax=Providencia manganoxydans TaxID=2923283 RepID=UPI003DA1AA9B